MSNAIEKSLVWDDFGKIGVWILEHSPKTLCAIFVAAIFLILAPTWLIHRMGLDRISSAHSLIPGVSALLSGSLLLIYAAAWTISLVKQWREIKRSRSYIATLTIAERKLLEPYLKHRTKSSYLDASDGIVKGLESKGIIYQASDLLVNANWSSTTYAFNLRDWAWDEIISNPSVLDTSDPN